MTKPTESLGFNVTNDVWLGNQVFDFLVLPYSPATIFPPSWSEHFPHHLSFRNQKFILFLESECPSLRAIHQDRPDYGFINSDLGFPAEKL
ncbi:hypothetical protein JYU34_020541 [Plutella xylostella]|uniref:Uncharacterized protein n=1 Tax=Plutella xylostella TaxID=51655 RepID=A0ABQ7PUM7_PLUXY|nr:hypothetical protein JYU34_020541 [Plutella xylostella]